MAKPRIFISSTFYDLRQIRLDLDKFIRELGYEPVLNELGNISYGKDEKLEEYCYKEINSIDILISVVGGRFGSSSQHNAQSISQTEFKTALELNKQLYIFIEKNVYAEYNTYLLNKENNDIKYRYADNIKIFEFIEFVEGLPNNNNVSSFESSLDIIQYLKEQWAGLFQRFLQEQTRIKEVNILKGIESTAKTLNQLVTFLTEERKDKDRAIHDILLSNHPAMETLAHLLNVSYRVYFTTKEELINWLSARSYKQDELAFIDLIFNYTDSRAKIRYTLRIDDCLFSPDGKLRVFTKDDWKDKYIQLEKESISVNEDDDLPF
jgi:hypothetical protein